MNRTRRDFLKFMGTAVGAASLADGLAAAGPSPAKKPNVLVILVDDLGYGDLSSHGAKDVKSPNIDGLVAAGMRFDNFYAQADQIVPEPATPGLLALGGLAATRRRRT